MAEVGSAQFWNNHTNTTAKVRAVVGTYTTAWVNLVQPGTNGAQPTTAAAFFTLMINMKEGKVNGINWDNNCVCDTCYQNQCHKKCATSGCDPNVKAYVVWTGTDKSNDVCLSAANRYSELAKYSTSQMYNNVEGGVNSYCANGGCDVPSISFRL